MQMLDKIYEFNEFRLDLSQKNLRKNGEIVAIQPKVFDLLRVFVERNNELISQNELINKVWGETFVEETSLRLCIHTLRKIFDGKYIETVPKRGYRFNAQIKETSSRPIESNPVSTRNLDENKSPQSYKKHLIAAVVLVSIIGIFSTLYLLKNKTTTAEKMTIAVLPFTQVSERTDKNLGVTDAVISQLTRLKDFKVLPIDSSETSADAILQGTFREENGVIKVSANLQNSNSKEILWTENFDVKPTKEIGIETSISARLARLFSIKMVEYDDEKFAKTQKVNPEALNAYISARKIWRVRDLGRVNEMGSLLQKAVELEPNWAFAHSAKAESLLMDDFIVTNYAKAEIVANSALEKDEKQFGALTVLGQFSLNKDWNFDQAELFFNKAIEINPNYASTYSEYAKLLSYQRKFAEAEKMSKKALEIEPFSPIYNTILCEIYYFDRKIDAALKQCNFAMQLEPDFWLARKQLFWIYVYKKMNKEVADMILVKLSDETKAKLPYIKSLQAGSLDEYWQNAIPQNGERANYLNAMMHLQINEKEKSLDNLEKATEGKDWLAFRLNSDPIFEPLWNETRFIELQKRLKNPK
jgi:DNA-binding winged helix-turn-helix (wHTH) protein/TolB-like protein/lipopolysaccharide biosynthesis regulator YciM